jgi:hypothetical protein
MPRAQIGLGAHLHQPRGGALEQVRTVAGGIEGIRLGRRGYDEAAALVVKGGLLSGRLLSAADFAALADVPPRDVLLATIAGGFQAPLVKAAGLFQAFTRNFAYGVQALIDQRGGAPAEETPADEPAEATPTAQEEPETEGTAEPAVADQSDQEKEESKSNGNDDD